MISPSLRKWLAYGTGVGVEITPSSMRVVVARVRQNVIRIAGTLVIERCQERPAAEWGAEYRAFLKKLGCGHVAATAVLPRHEVIVRQVAMPGVANKDLPAAIGFEIDSLHPFADEGIAYDYCRVGKSGNVLVGITREEILNRYATLLGEAGIKLASVTFSAPVIYSALRLHGNPPAEGFLLAVGLEAGAGEDGSLEVYGESPSRPVFSSTFDSEPARAASLAAADLRLDPETRIQDPIDMLPPHRGGSPDDRAGMSRDGIAYAAALASACPWLSLKLNLLPPERRVNTSRLIYVPTAALLLILAGAAVAIPAYRKYEDRQYLALIQKEAAKVEGSVRQIDSLDAMSKELLSRIGFLAEYRRRTGQDLDLLLELTKVLAPPVWLKNAEVTRGEVTIQGEAEKADGLLQVLDNTPYLAGSDFTTPIARVGDKETFRIKSRREGGQ